MHRRRGGRGLGRLKDARPLDWWRAWAWPARVRVRERTARHLKRIDTNAEKTEVSTPPKKPGKTPPRKR
jgi:hypothetical protein